MSLADEDMGLKHLAADYRKEHRLTRGERPVVSRAGDQLLRGHVTEALFTLKLDTPVRHCVKGWEIIKAGQSCKERA